MKRALLLAPTVLLIFSTCVPQSAAFASNSAKAQPQVAQDAVGTPDLNRGIDLSRLPDDSYVESLSSVAEQLSNLTFVIRNVLVGDTGLVDFGYMTGTQSLVVYWSGDPEAPILARVAQLASERGLGLVVAPRKVSKAQLESAENDVVANLKQFDKLGIVLSAYGGFAADFDGLKVTVNEQKSSLKDKTAIEAALRSSVSVPVAVSFANITNLVGKYDDFAPFNGGGGMVGQKICTSGFGVVYGASVYRFLSARHCVDGPYYTEPGTNLYGSITLSGTGTNGAAVFGGQGSALVFDGSYVGNPTTTRTVTQKDPALSTVGTQVCQEGSNSGQRCGTIQQVALNLDDGFGSMIKVNYVTSGSTAKIAAAGDSGGPVITTHTLSRAWAVGILQAGQNTTTVGCTERYPGNVCSDNFFFSNVDYALGGFTSYAIRYG